MKIICDSPMKKVDKPIIFSDGMVRAILSGRKTMTRRVVKPQPPLDVAPYEIGVFNPTVVDKYGEEDGGDEIFGVYDQDGEWGAKFPYGGPGSRIWVKESWRTDQSDEGTGGIIYRADHDIPAVGKCIWKNPLFMPRLASRITLEIISVRVERLWEITPGDAWAEGCPHSDMNAVSLWFRPLWDSINADRGFGWDKNPLVWVIEFKRIIYGAETIKRRINGKLCG